jgi:hypothetical protein
MTMSIITVDYNQKKKKKTIYRILLNFIFAIYAPSESPFIFSCLGLQTKSGARW